MSELRSSFSRDSKPSELEWSLSVLPATRLSARQAAACRALSMRAAGRMAEELTYARGRYGRDYQVVLAGQPDGRLLGWCLLSPGGQSNIYVRQSARRQGIGSALMREGVRLSRERMKVIAHDQTSWSFFGRFSSQVQLGGWYRPGERVNEFRTDKVRG